MLLALAYVTDEIVNKNSRMNSRVITMTTRRVSQANSSPNPAPDEKATAKVIAASTIEATKAMAKRRFTLKYLRFW